MDKYVIIGLCWFVSWVWIGFYLVKDIAMLKQWWTLPYSLTVVMIAVIGAIVIGSIVKK